MENKKELLNQISKDYNIDYNELINKYDNNYDINNNEPLTISDNRYTTFPINNRYINLWNSYKKQLASFWVPEEIDFSQDNFDELTEDEQYFIENILAFFAASDGIVNENIEVNFLQDINVYEAKLCYVYQEMMENIHSETYSLLIDTYIKDSTKKEKLFNAIKTIPSIKQKADWTFKHINDKNCSLAKRLVIFAIVEGVMFQGSFCAIFWLKEQGKLPGLCHANKQISKDEGLHAEFSVELYHLTVNKLSQEEIYNIFNEAIQIEKEFICESIPCKLIGMNSNLMSQYIEYIADRLIIQLGYNKLFNVSNPFDFMELSSVEDKVNFFERKVGEYSIPGVGKSDKDNKFSLDADF